MAKKITAIQGYEGTAVYEHVKTHILKTGKKDPVMSAKLVLRNTTYTDEGKIFLLNKILEELSRKMGFSFEFGSVGDLSIPYELERMIQTKSYKK